jgi:hypothetical protein
VDASGPQSSGEVVRTIDGVTVSVGGPPSGGNIVLSLALVGKAGETYFLGLRQGATRSSPPKVKVLDASGKILAEGNSEYG